MISPHVHLCEQLMPWQWRWLGFVARLIHVMKDLIAYETWHSHVTKVEKIKTKLGLMDRLQAWRASWRHWSDGPRGGEAWARLGANRWRQWWKASEVKIDEPIRSCDHMKWIISFVIWLVHVLHQHLRRWNGCARQRYICRAFHFISHMCAEKFMTRFRIDGRTIKRGKLVCISVV
jgi:hypothetical protein